MLPINSPVKGGISSLRDDSNQHDLEYTGHHDVSLPLTHYHTYRHTIILFRSDMLALIYHCNWLPSNSGLILSLFACVCVWCFSLTKFQDPSVPGTQLRALPRPLKLGVAI